MTASTVPATGAPAGDRRRQDVSRMARGGALNLAGSIVNAAGSFALVLILTHNLGAGPSGAFLEAVAVFQVLATAGQLGADTGLARFIPLSLTRGRVEQLRTWTRLAVVPVALVGTVTGALTYFSAEPLARLVAKGDDLEDFVTYIRVLAPLVPLGAVYFVLQTGTRAFGTMKPSVVVERLGRALLQPVLMSIVFLAGLGTSAVVWAWAGPYVLAAACLAVWYRAQIRRAERRSDRLRVGEVGGKPQRRLSDLGLDDDLSPITAAPPVEADARTFWRFASPRAIAGVFQVAVMWLDVLLVGALASTQAAGIYSAASRWLVGGMFIAFAINQAFQPQISAVLAQADTTRATALFESAASWAVAFVAPVYLTLAIFAPVLMRVFPPAFAEGAPALAVLAVGGIIAAASGPVDMVLLMGGRSAWNLATSAMALAVTTRGAIMMALDDHHPRRVSPCAIATRSRSHQTEERDR